MHIIDYMVMIQIYTYCTSTPLRFRKFEVVEENIEEEEERKER